MVRAQRVDWRPCCTLVLSPHAPHWSPAAHGAALLLRCSCDCLLSFGICCSLRRCASPSAAVWSATSSACTRCLRGRLFSAAFTRLPLSSLSQLLSSKHGFRKKSGRQIQTWTRCRCRGSRPVSAENLPVLASDSCTRPQTPASRRSPVPHASGLRRSFSDS